MRGQKARRAFTIVEMLISMAIMGIILALAIVEFTMVFNHNKLSNADLSAEQNARVALAKVTNEMRQAMPDVTDATPPYTVVVSPTAPPPSTAPAVSTSIQYYRVASLPGAASATPVPTGVNGQPLPCYDLVTLSYDAVAKTISRTIHLVSNANCAAVSDQVNNIAYNVVSFGITPITAKLFDVDLQTVASYQGHTTGYNGGTGIYDLNTHVALGY